MKAILTFLGLNAAAFYLAKRLEAPALFWLFMLAEGAILLLLASATGGRMW